MKIQLYCYAAALVLCAIMNACSSGKTDPLLTAVTIPGPEGLNCFAITKGDAVYGGGCVVKP